MFCLYCGNKLPDDAIFCNMCGKRQNREESNPVLPSSPLLVPPMSGVQIPPANVPFTQGTPQASNVPFTQGTPSPLGNHFAGQSAALPHNTTPGSAAVPSWNSQAGSNAPQMPIRLEPPTTIPYDPHHVEQPHHTTAHQPPHDEPHPSHRRHSGELKIGRHFSRRAVVTGLIGGGAVVVASGLGLVAALSHRQLELPSSVPVPTPTHVPMGTILLTYSGVSGFASSVAWAPTVNTIAAASKVVYIWDASLGNTLLTYRGHSSYLRSLEWSRSGAYIASGGGDTNSANSDFSVQVWDPTTGNLITKFTNHTNSIQGITWSPNAQQIATCAFGDNVYVWDATSGNINLTYNSNPGIVLCIAWSPDGQRIATGDGQGYIKIWDSTTGSVIQTYFGHTSQVNGVAWSPDGKFVASVSGGNLTNRSPNGQGDSSLQVWDPNTGNTHFRVVSGAWTVAWSPDGKRILITSAGHQIYDASNGNLLFTFKSQSSATAWSPDGTRVVSESDDKTVVIWQSL